MNELYSKLISEGTLLYIDNGKLKAKSSKGSLDQDTIALIKNNKEALLSYLQKKDQEQAYNQVVRRRVEDRAAIERCSFAQQRLWFIDQMDGSSEQYNMFGAVRFTGDFVEDIAEQVAVAYRRNSADRALRDYLDELWKDADIRFAPGAPLP